MSESREDCSVPGHSFVEIPRDWEKFFTHVSIALTNSNEHDIRYSSLMRLTILAVRIGNRCTALRFFLKKHC